MPHRDDNMGKVGETVYSVLLMLMSGKVIVGMLLNGKASQLMNVESRKHGSLKRSHAKEAT